MTGREPAKAKEPLWAKAARAYADGRLQLLPRMPTVRPETDYEMKFPDREAVPDGTD